VERLPANGPKTPKPLTFEKCDINIIYFGNRLKFYKAFFINLLLYNLEAEIFFLFMFHTFGFFFLGLAPSSLAYFLPDMAPAFLSSYFKSNFAINSSYIFYSSSSSYFCFCSSKF
jgi:hypothetical protein